MSSRVRVRFFCIVVYSAMCVSVCACSLLCAHVCRLCGVYSRVLCVCVVLCTVLSIGGCVCLWCVRVYSVFSVCSGWLAFLLYVCVCGHVGLWCCIVWLFSLCIYTGVYVGACSFVCVCVVCCGVRVLLLVSSVCWGA